MQELVDFIARALVGNPEDVEVIELGSHKLELSVLPEDLGRVIGRRGRTAKAIRTLLRASFGADLEIAEGDEDEGDEEDELSE